MAHGYTKAEIARLRGVTPASISWHAERGKLGDPFRLNGRVLYRPEAVRKYLGFTVTPEMLAKVKKPWRGTGRATIGLKAHRAAVEAADRAGYQRGYEDGKKMGRADDVTLAHAQVQSFANGVRQADADADAFWLRFIQTFAGRGLGLDTIAREAQKVVTKRAQVALVKGR